ncbi:hypothetical protein JD965_17770 [Bacillus siamensis]|uniref:hypothetical protein n=1 Tax=Bacillus siamensis TaxID=659243 RepID=UPI0006467B0A|nr:hypothetical protein [Bacillus siamensis]OAZ68628.1 uncharacterized protein SRCM100169_00945 [Bacillus siamensis]QQD81691.1 hypothetical protein JD965_17770 [Bacillus siamensis]UZD73820.1 hypothetical protein OM992_19035 [Bacillus siamensis]
MNQLRLKEIYIEDGLRREEDHSYLVSKKEECEVHLNRRGNVVFLYETKDRMEQYKIQLSLADKKLSFYWFAWDGGKFVRMFEKNWLKTKLFSRLLKNTYYISGQKKKFFLSERKAKS